MDTKKHMNDKSFLLAIILTLLCFSSCTQNDGHIGPIFGSWSLICLTEDGVNVELGDDTVFSFQDEIVKIIRLVNPPYSYVTRYGNFILSDDLLTLKFQDAPTPSDSHMYMTPDWLHFPNDGPIRLRILQLTGNKMQLSLECDGKTYVYSFRKTW